ncbi:MAG: hypothetical protein AVDCRST_MAG93-3089 [uncultured Chloroflexia bacterium]|uniref:Uncharacterized protein n=1 Tax=uncultured Chloroflexia bacterium TaxID=1672391 RepID=A0A6J4JJE3_9CHLR|nr:MAG: hypothetical protein AVDCRST_MAG93-3089 [uncultured Chloroflexia bacterium]
MMRWDFLARVDTLTLLLTLDLTQLPAKLGNNEQVSGSIPLVSS